MRDRTHHYRDRCESHGWTNIVTSGGIKSYGKVRYGDDGMLYIGRKKHGPYMVLKNYGFVGFLIRFDDLDNVHRFESLRWKVLLHIQELVADLRKATKRGPAIGFYANLWHSISFGGSSLDWPERKPLNVDETNVLDMMANTNKSEMRLVSNYLRRGDQLIKYWAWARVIEHAMAHLFSTINIARCGLARTNASPAEGVSSSFSSMSFLVNGRTYYDSGVKLGYQMSDQHWASPMMPHMDLDAARYVPEVSSADGRTRSKVTS